MTSARAIALGLVRSGYAFGFRFTTLGSIRPGRLATIFCDIK
ncbi:MAG: hypothetical protein ACI82Z_001680 [Cellvibrionaceae bacterium]|jgi:hypothetical protein